VIFCIQTFETVRAIQMKSNGNPHVSPFYVYTIMNHICSHITFGSLVVSWGLFVCLFVCVCLYLIQIHISEPIWTKLCTHLPLGLEETVWYVWTQTFWPCLPFSGFVTPDVCFFVPSSNPYFWTHVNLTLHTSPPWSATDRTVSRDQTFLHLFDLLRRFWVFLYTASFPFLPNTNSHFLTNLNQPLHT
jgi:hypothetical protein